VEKDKTKLFQAILVDPLTSAILTINETRTLVDEMFKAEKEYLKGFDNTTNSRLFYRVSNVK